MALNVDAPKQPSCTNLSIAAPFNIPHPKDAKASVMALLEMMSMVSNLIRKTALAKLARRRVAKVPWILSLSLILITSTSIVATTCTYVPSRRIVKGDSAETYLQVEFLQEAAVYKTWL